MLKAYQQREHLPVAQAQGNPILSTLGTVAGTAAGAAIGGPAGAAIGGSLGSQLGNVASGAPIDPAQMAMSGLSSGLTSGSQAASEAAKGLDAAKQSVVTEFAKDSKSAAYDEAVKKLQEAGMKSMEAENSMLNDPFGRAGKAVKSVFLAEGGDVKPEENKKNKLKRDKNGNLILPLNIDFSKLQPMSEAEKRQRAALDQQTRSVAYKAQGGPLCSKCEAEYKACGGMAKKRY